ADLILEAVKTLSEPDIRPERQAHAVQLATVAFYMPCGDQIALIDRLLGLPPPRMVKLDFLRALAHSGEAIPCESLLEGLRSLLD
ncbi:hypothetical protein, partial [Pseudomonas aeruginosa]|uniref:hypothetical protein n=1 Tax=Pseudomonas aeruginosa TaxID=287 RepID=UPI0034593C0E